MSSSFGNSIKISIFGQSHSNSIGVVIDGLPAGERIDLDALSAFCARRAPGHDPLSTSRVEADAFEILSGLVNGATCGAPFAAVIKNTNTRAGDYSEFSDKPRPSHADFTATIKYGGAADYSGGGHFSGRLTAPLCIAGGICMQLLERRGIYIGAHHARIGRVEDKPFDAVALTRESFDKLIRDGVTAIDPVALEAMKSEIRDAANDGDSVGGVIECAAVGLPAGLGEPMFDGMENRIAQAVFAVPGVKGIEFGSGFYGSSLRGSQNNDPFVYESDRVVTETNSHGGILGGITSGMPLVFRAAMKPTPSIFKGQRTVSLSQKENVPLTIHGRHDPCIALRALCPIEASAAIAIYDALAESKKYL